MEHKIDVKTICTFVEFRGGKRKQFSAAKKQKQAMGYISLIKKTKRSQ
jgi:hypothetical protein